MVVTGKEGAGADCSHHKPGSREEKTWGPMVPFEGTPLMIGFPLDPYLLKILSAFQYHYPGDNTFIVGSLGTNSSKPLQLGWVLRV